LASIDICLATFNGADWLKDFLDSLIRQDFKGWRLIASDDGSSDGTLEILRTYFRNDATRLLLVERQRTGAGVVRNFQDALAASTADYIFLADQDDVWLPNKLSELYAAIRIAEGTVVRPALVFSDMAVVDESLAPLSGSWWGYSSVSPSWALTLRHLLAQNTVPGCSMVMNRRLLDLALPLPEQALMHDWWLLLVCQLSGTVDYCPRVTMLYRRHQQAVTYAPRGGWGTAMQRFLFERQEVRSLFQGTARQAHVLLTRLEAAVARDHLVILRDYVQASEAGWFARRWLLMKSRVRRPSFMGTIRMYFWI